MCSTIISEELKRENTESGDRIGAKEDGGRSARRNGLIVYYLRAQHMMVYNKQTLKVPYVEKQDQKE